MLTYILMMSPTLFYIDERTLKFALKNISLEKTVICGEAF